MKIGSAPEHVPLQTDIAHLRFCTDGGCDDATEDDFRHGSWSVMWDKTYSDAGRQKRAARTT